MIKKLIKLLIPLVLAISLLLTSCTSDGESKNPPVSGKANDTASVQDGNEDASLPDDGASSASAEYFDGWTLCWYLCGSNLESIYGCASLDLAEMQAVQLPDNVRVLIETGGAYDWQTDGIKSGVIQRHILDSNGLTLLEELPEADMGSCDTLSSFLSFCEGFPSSRRAMIFWNHGGGSVSGAEFDEVYGYDSLTLNEFSSAFERVHTRSLSEPAFDIIGFDACLMATIDTAKTFEGFGRYLVASQETEPGCGWNYTGILQAAADHPGMDGQALGQCICDTYAEGCRECGVDSSITLSVTDLSKIDPLLLAYNSLGDEALLSALESPEFLVEFGRRALITENYGGNTPELGYTNMVDLGHLVSNSGSILPNNSQAVLDALNKCVVYKTNGVYHPQSSGLSCYYYYSGDLDNFVDYTAVGASESFKYLYAFGLTDKLSAAGEEYVHSILKEKPDVTPSENGVPVLQDFNLSEVSHSYVDEYGYPVLELEPSFAKALRDVRIRIRQAFVADTEPLRLDIVAWGESDQVGRDWESGIFRAYFDGHWAVLDDAVLYMENVHSADDYVLYSSPVMLNGTLCNLQIAYEKVSVTLPGGAVQTDYDWHILGAREGLDASTGMADKNLILFKPGDEIIPVYLVMQDAGSEDAAWEHFYQSENAVIYSTETELDLWADVGPAVYDIEFEMVDSRNQKAYSERFVLQVYDYEVSAQLWDDFMADKGNEVYRWR